MKKIYKKAEISIVSIKSNDVITLSGGLIFGGDKGQSQKESFSSLFGSEQ